MERSESWCWMVIACAMGRVWGARSLCDLRTNPLTIRQTTSLTLLPKQTLGVAESALKRLAADAHRIVGFATARACGVARCDQRVNGWLHMLRPFIGRKVLPATRSNCRFDRCHRRNLTTDRFRRFRTRVTEKESSKKSSCIFAAHDRRPTKFGHGIRNSVVILLATEQTEKAVFFGHGNTSYYPFVLCRIETKRGKVLNLDSSEYGFRKYFFINQTYMDQRLLDRFGYSYRGLIFSVSCGIICLEYIDR